MSHARQVASKLSELEDKGAYSLLVNANWQHQLEGRNSNVANAIAARRKTLLEVSDI